LFRAVVGLGFLALSIGWLRAQTGIAILNLETGQRHLRILPGKYNELPIDVEETTRTFRTLQRKGARAMRLRTVDFEGKTRSERTLPLVDRTFEQYGSSWTYAFSPDGNRVVYLEGKSRELRLFDFTERGYRVLETNLTSSSVHIVFLSWLPDGQVLVGARIPEEAERDKILLIDPTTASTTVVARPRSLASFNFDLSHSGRCLAYWEGSDRATLEGQFVLYSLALRRPMGTIQSMSGGWLRQPRWSLDDRYVAYVEGGRMTAFYSVADRTSYVISHGATNELVDVYAFGKRDVIYKQYPRAEGYLDKPLRVRDIFNRHEREISSLRISGRAFLVENGTLLIATGDF
jgi:hypothetical protein